MIISLLLAAGVTLTFPMEVKVQGTEVTVNEIARITGDDLEEVRLVGRVDLGYAPMPGHSRLFFGKRVAEIVKRETGVDVTLAGDRAVRAFPKEVTIKAIDIESAARVELLRLTTKIDAEYVLQDTPRNVSVPAGNDSVRLEAFFEKPEVQSGVVSIPVRIIIDEQVYRTVWTRWSIAVHELRTVLVSPVAAGEALTAKHFTQKRMLVPRVGGANPLGRDLALGAVASRDMKAGEMVTTLDVNRPMIIRRGDTIFLQARSRAITARVPATAEEDGALGDRIMVVTLDSGRRMGAVVKSRDLVEIVISR